MTAATAEPFPKLTHASRTALRREIGIRRKNILYLDNEVDKQKVNGEIIELRKELKRFGNLYKKNNTNIV